MYKEEDKVHVQRIIEFEINMNCVWTAYCSLLPKYCHDCQHIAHMLPIFSCSAESLALMVKKFPEMLLAPILALQCQDSELSFHQGKLYNDFVWSADICMISFQNPQKFKQSVLHY